ncbi:stage II sporulation protein M [Paenibacillus silagei]|uniref:Stage II sporulation protein M n=1 Tax=Paenibacillus silagei TaxID=1670801 RepID=A0ABS4NVU5_9BACL|nr:stage II sporulation protein M [Paenibacillus silagei]MBP2114176.1 hypothetical protein [Paenibacillus silagei]
MKQSVRKLKFIRKPIEIIKENKKAFILMNAVFYGLLLLTMIVTAIFPDLQAKTIDNANQQLSAPWLESTVVAAYTNGNVGLASIYTFLVNLILGTFLSMTLPSLVIPFAGLIMGGYRAIFWGMTFAPLNGVTGLLPHYLTLLIEGQAYVIAMFAIVIQGRSLLFPRRIGLASRWNGYKQGLIQSAWLYLPVILLLVVGGVYEAIELIVLAPPGN